MKAKDVLLNDQELKKLQSMLLQDKDLYNKIVNLNEKSKRLQRRNHDLLNSLAEMTEEVGLI